MGGKTMSLGHFDSNLIGQYHALVAGGSAGQVNGRTLEFEPNVIFQSATQTAFVSRLQRPDTKKAVLRFNSLLGRVLYELAIGIGRTVEQSVRA